MSEYRELLIGCGRSREKRIPTKEMVPDSPIKVVNGKDEWCNLTTLDMDESCGPDVIADIRWFHPWRSAWRTKTFTSVGDLMEPVPKDSLGGYVQFKDSVFDEVHAYEVLEHLGGLGDYQAYFADFSEIWRILKPGGLLCATVPSRYSEGLWGDPGHCRSIPPMALTFLDQTEYARQCDGLKNSMSDYRSVYKADFHRVFSLETKDTHTFVLKAIKPSRIKL